MYSGYVTFCCLLIVWKLILLTETTAFPISRIAGKHDKRVGKREEFWRFTGSKPPRYYDDKRDVLTTRESKLVEIMTTKPPMEEELLQAVQRLLLTEPVTDLPSKKTVGQAITLKQTPKPTTKQNVSPAEMQTWKTKEVLVGRERGHDSLVKTVRHLDEAKETSSAAVEDLHRSEHHIPVNMCITELSSGKYNEGKLLLAIKDCLNKKKWFEHNKKPFSLEQCMDSDLPEDKEIRFSLEQCLGKDYDLLGIKAEKVLMNRAKASDEKLEEELSEIKPKRSTEKPLQHLLQKGLPKTKTREDYDKVKKMNVNVFRSATGVKEHTPVDRCFLEVLSNKHNQDKFATVLELCKESEKLSKYSEETRFSLRDCLLEEFPILKQCMNTNRASKLEEPEMVDIITTEDDD